MFKKKLILEISMLSIVLLFIQIFGLLANIKDPKKGGGQTCNCCEEKLSSTGQYVELYHCKMEVSTWARSCKALCRIPGDNYEQIWDCGTTMLPNVYCCVEHPNETWDLGCDIIQDYAVLLEPYFPSCGTVCFLSDIRNECIYSYEATDIYRLY